MRCKLLFAAVTTALVGACAKGDAFRAHPDIAAHAAGQDLTAARVAEIMVGAKQAQMTPEAGEFIANLWIDYTLFAQRVADNKLQVDSTLISDALWPQIVQMRFQHWLDTLNARNVHPTDQQIDSVYGAGEVRVAQHILINTEKATPAQKAAARKKIDALLAQARAGKNFGELAMASSEDRGSAADSGYLPPFIKGDMVGEFDSVASRMTPGQISDVFASQFGWHIIRRPTMAESRARLRPRVVETMTAKFDSTYFSNLEKTTNAKVSSDVVARLRAVFADMNAERNNRAKLVTYTGGDLTVAEFVRWMRGSASDPSKEQQMLAQLKAIPDSMLDDMAKSVANNQIVAEMADKDKAQLSREEWDTLKVRFARSIDTLRASIGLTPDQLDSKASAKDRERAAALKVDQYFDRLVQGNAMFHLLPGMLSWSLRADGDFGTNPAGIKQAVDLAMAKKGPADTSRQSPMQPAPGGPPVPGATPAPGGATPAPVKP